MMTMTTARAGLKNIDLTKVLQFLEIVVNAGELKKLTEELRVELELAQAEQAKTLEYAGNLERLQKSDQLLAEATAANETAQSAARTASEQARQVIEQAQEQAGLMAAAAREEVAGIRGDIDARHAEASSDREDAHHAKLEAEEINRSAKEAHAEAMQMREDMDRKISEMRRLAG